jgi:hypothetical protein
MNEDYLWDRSGDDPEIEKLERTLAVFRYTETEAPVGRVAKAVTLLETAPRWKFSFAYAFAALAVAVVLAGVWLQTSNLPGTFDNTMASVAPSQASGEPRDQPEVIADHVVPIDRVQNMHRRSTSLRKSAKRTPALTDPQTKTTRVRSRERHGTAALTKEEKYAYGQLMLALSITGSKLKIVKDTINGIEERENAAKENER